jgi:LemA protein
MVVIVVLVLLAVAALWSVMTYNQLVKARNQVSESWAGMDVQLTKRHDLVPNLVTCVKGYAAHEQGTLEAVVQARNAINTNAPTGSAGENQLSGQLKQLFALAERYPDLKADANFRQLSNQLVKIEDDLQYARRYYNGSIRDLNNLVEGFPSLIIASIGHFTRGQPYEVASALDRESVEVKL